MFKTTLTERKRISEERLEICNECPSFEQERSRCKECGCFMEYKSLFTSSKCPLNKWKE